MSIPPTERPALALETISGPTSVRLELREPGVRTIGRRATNDIALTSDVHVSRDHARIDFIDDDHGGEWAISDAGSRHGTWLNGDQLEPNRPVRLRPGDVITIAPWAFRVVSLNEHTSRRVASTIDDAPIGATIAPIAPDADRSLASERLALLLDLAGGMSSASTKEALAEAVLDAAVNGAGMRNAAFIESFDEEGSVVVLAHRGAILPRDDGRPTISRSLLRMAAGGAAASLTSQDDAPAGADSIVSFNIAQALCVPIIVDGAPEAYLYLDSRGSRQAWSSQQEDAARFAVGLSKLASMSLANLKRLEIEREQAIVEADLRAAAEAQRWILPRREIRIGSLCCVGESRPGRYVGGDFFDVAPLSSGAVAITLGDVSGKGVAASVLMTASQGFLHAALQHEPDPARAVHLLNEFLLPRCPDGRFVTLWVGVFDPARSVLRYVDAGHGHAYLADGRGGVRTLDRAKGPPVGIMDEVEFPAGEERLEPDGAALLVSDGFIEQPALNDRRSMFGSDRVCAALAPSQEDRIARLFEEVHAFAQSDRLADDATAVLVTWG